MTIWFVARAAGLTAFLAFSLATGLGAAGSSLGRSPHTRLIVQYVHRSAAVTGLIMLSIHIASLILDHFAKVGVAGAFIPGTSTFRPVWVALGTIAMYLFVAAAVSGMARSRLVHSPATLKWWRPVHLASYAAWSLSAVHFLRSGTDVGQGWTTGIFLGGLAIVTAGLTNRVVSTPPAVATHRQSITRPVAR